MSMLLYYAAVFQNSNLFSLCNNFSSTEWKSFVITFISHNFHEGKEDVKGILLYYFHRSEFNKQPAKLLLLQSQPLKQILLQEQK